MDIERLICCPDCLGDLVRIGEGQMQCAHCQKNYGALNGIYYLMPESRLIDKRGVDNVHYQKWLKISSDALVNYFEHGNIIFNNIHHSCHRIVDRHLRRNAQSGYWLDLGCGAGAHYCYYNDISNVVGIDSNLESLNRIKTDYPDALLIQGDWYRLPFRSETFAVVMSIYCLEHMFWLQVALSEVRRVLRSDGLFFAGIPCEGGLLWGLGRRMTSERTLSKRYDIDYRQVIEIEHCNRASKILEELQRMFNVKKVIYYPFSFAPNLNVNLTITLMAEKG